MNHRPHPCRTLSLCGLLMSLLIGCSAKSGVEVSVLSLGAAPPGAPMRAGYVTLTNHDGRPRTLTHATSTAYEIVEFHITQTENGVARMRQEKDLVLAPHAELKFEPYGRHLMLMRPTTAATARPILIELCFADGECVTASSTSDTK